MRLDVLFFDAEVLYETDTLREQFQHAEGYYHNLVQITAPCTGAELLTQLSEKRMYRVSPCLQFSRAEFLRENRITFYPGIIHEDNLYTFTCILLAKRAFKLDEDERKKLQQLTLSSNFTCAFSHSRQRCKVRTVS